MARVSDAERSRRVLVVHAHPDDEVITTGGLLGRCGEARREHEHFHLAWNRHPSSGFDDLFEPVPDQR